MAVLERERLQGLPGPYGAAESPWEEWPILADGGPPEVPPAFYWDDDGGDDDDGSHSWGRRIVAAVGIVVLLCMIISPVAADVLAGPGASHGSVTTPVGDR